MNLKESLTKRLNRLRQKLIQENLEAFLILDPINIFYMTQCHVDKGILLITLDSVEFYLDGRLFEEGKEVSPYPPTLIKKWAETMEGLKFPEKTGFDGTVTSFSEYEAFAKKGPLKSSKRFLTTLRSVKDDYEIGLMRQSGKIICEIFQAIPALLKEGITEKQIVFEMEKIARQKGVEKWSFDPIIAFGASSSKPHYSPRDIPLKPQEAIMVDAGVFYEGYASDMTRSFFYKEPPKKLYEIYQTVLRIQESLLKEVKSGASLKKIGEEASALIEAAGYDFIHNLGHGVGLEIHEDPCFGQDVIAESGMCITVEPGIYVPGLGGVRIEDTVVVTEKGYESLTPYRKG